jgi:hypothetical protein
MQSKRTVGGSAQDALTTSAVRKGERRAVGASSLLALMLALTMPASWAVGTADKATGKAPDRAPVKQTDKPVEKAADLHTAAPSPPPLDSTSSGQQVQAVRVLATRAHTQCPLGGKKLAVLSIDSPREWKEKLLQEETAVVGRPIKWSREQVLVYAMNQQPTLGVGIEPASRVLALNSGVLMWPVKETRPGPGQMAAQALSRPCLVAVVKRAYYQRIRIVRR